MLGPALFAFRKRCLGVAVFVLTTTYSVVGTTTSSGPIKWDKFVKMTGQNEPVPVQWLQNPEALIAFSLILPDKVSRTVPFDFEEAYRWSWVPGTSKVSLRYFNHLCSTEAGEWIFKKIENVEGFYFARPQAEPSTDLMTDLYGPEMPWIQRRFMLRADTLHDQGTAFIQPPLYNYRFIEQPRRPVDWQSKIGAPYIRLFGYTRERANNQGGSLTDHFRQKDPMQVAGIPEPTARYGYTWRGIRRVRDREHGIAGGELLIYDRLTKEVLAARRQFLIAAKNPRGTGKAMWEVATSCSQVRAYPESGEFSQFLFDVLLTSKPSATRKQ